MQSMFYQLLYWLDPWYWISLAGIVCVLILIHPLPLSTDKEVSLAEQVVMYVRRLVLIVLLGLLLVCPLLVAMFSFGLSQDSVYTQRVLTKVFITSLKQQWTWLLAGVMGGIFFKIAWQRYLLPHWSAWWSHRRVAQRGDLPSDVRAEAARLNPKEFDPQKHYRSDQIFMGLNSRNKPIYVPVDQWKMENQKIIGPTQTGKGVIIGVQLDQAIRHHMCTVFIDPKPDKHALAIMQRACKETGRQLVTLDFTGHLPGKWAPFRTGTDREIKTRIYTSLGLLETGKESDFFKIKERQIIDKLFPQWDKEIHGLYKALQSMESPPERALGVISEYHGLKTINPTKHRGVDIERALKENAVVYVRGSTTDPLIVQICSLLIQCILQATMRLFTQQQRDAHLFLCIDEVRFMVTDLLADTLATITGTDAHLAIAYQSLEDIRNIKDVNINARSVERSINVNCKSAIYYQAADFETAEYAAEQTGTRQVSRYRFNVKQNVMGGETYTDRHMITQEDQPFINPNTLLMLPERVALHKRPNQLAELLYTAWVNIEKTTTSPNKLVDAKQTTPPSSAAKFIDKDVNHDQTKHDTSIPTAQEGEMISFDDALKDYEKM